jgi:hypothetical protein
MIKEDIEYVATLTSEGIYYRLESIFAEPVNVSLTMANDSLLNEYLLKEGTENDEEYVYTITNYLDTYRQKYGYDSVFLVSVKTSRYYNFDGINRVLTKDNPENDWFYSSIDADGEHSLNVDNDEAAQNEITVFINCKIKDSDGSVIGIVGVGLRIDYLQNLLKEYENQFCVGAFLVNSNGIIEISTEQTGFQNVDFFDTYGYNDQKDEILGASAGFPSSYWIDHQNSKNYIVAQYIPALSWYLIIENNTDVFDSNMTLLFFHMTIIVCITIIVVLLITTHVIKQHSKKIIELTVSREQERQSVFRNATEQLYDNIYEMNITHNRAAGKSTEQYLQKPRHARRYAL